MTNIMIGTGGEEKVGNVAIGDEGGGTMKVTAAGRSSSLTFWQSLSRTPAQSPVEVHPESHMYEVRRKQNNLPNERRTIFLSKTCKAKRVWIQAFPAEPLPDVV